MFKLEGVDCKYLDYYFSGLAKMPTCRHPVKMNQAAPIRQEQECMACPHNKLRIHFTLREISPSDIEKMANFFSK